MKSLARNLLVSLMVCPTLGFAQQTPLFQFTMHFEDSLGNRDSIVLGYDPTASSQDLNPQFGEILLNTPFDSVFEVRSIHGDDGQNLTTKKVIENVDILSWDSCQLPFFSKIAIYAKFAPVKISYDSTLFPRGTCRNVVLSPEWNLFLLQEWWDTKEYHCMGSSAMYVEDFQQSSWNVLKVEKEVEGQGIKEIPGVFFAMFYGPGPCNDTTFLSIDDKTDLSIGMLSPNPVEDHFSIQVPGGAEVWAEVKDVSGRMVSCPFVISGETVQFDATRLPPGIYFVNLRAKHQRQLSYKVVKQ